VVLSRRERFIAIATGAILGIFATDRLVVEPLLSTRSELDSQITSQRSALDRAQRLFTTNRQMAQRWKQIAGSELKASQSEAEGQVIHNVHDWAQESGLALPSLKSERAEKEKDFNKLSFRATGSGTMSQITRFLWRIQTATMPIRITELLISSRKEGTDDLSLTLGISTIQVIQDPSHAKPSAPPAPAPRDRGQSS
jgi:hypothetical protein